jgi:hypothetical protein
VTDIHALDWRNITLPGGARERASGQGWVIRRGKAVMGGREGEVTVAGVLFGDLDGDGKDEAVVRLDYIGLLGGNNHGSFVEVFALRAGRLALLADQNLANDGDTLESIKLVKRQIVVEGEAHAPDDAVCCPSLHHVSRFALVRGKLVRVARDVSKPADAE